MTRKFTPPTAFPTEYTLDSGDAAHVCGSIPGTVMYFGYVKLCDGNIYGHTWNSLGYDAEIGDHSLDLHDIQTKRVLYREFGVLGRHTIECNTDGSGATVVFEKRGSYI
jgi:hypothetical protein